MTKKEKDMLFSEIPGNNKVKQELISSVKKGRIAHAQLFLGNPGNAKLSLAIAYAQFLNCEHKKEDDSCNNCYSCLMYNQLTHPDLHIIFPVLKINKIKNPISENFIAEWRKLILENPYISPQDWYQYLGVENKQGVIYKHEARDLQKKLTLKNYESAFRIVLIWMPEKMNHVTANKLLKLIEEPPNGTYILMVSEDYEQLLPTIISRTQIIKNKPFNSQEVASFLKKEKGISNEKAEIITINAKGNMNKAIQLCVDEIEEVSSIEAFQKWMQICYRVSLNELSSLTDEFAKKGRENQKVFFQYSSTVIRECLMFNVFNKELSLDNKQERFVKNFAPYINEENSVSIFERLEKAIKNIERNANPKIIFYELSLQMMRLLKVKRKLAN
ncbi:MAG: hypothetical protein CBC83_07295 [Flavobacteriales bacterium TMED123]|nr:MAG: hypothetical protein CBC83_07295 [Flavobacteriales bacterium TMED123]